MNRFLQISLHVKGVATLPCELLVSKTASTESTATADEDYAHTEENVTAVGELVQSQ